MIKVGDKIMVNRHKNVSLDWYGREGVIKEIITDNPYTTWYHIQLTSECGQACPCLLLGELEFAKFGDEVGG